MTSAQKRQERGSSTVFACWSSEDDMGANGSSPTGRSVKDSHTVVVGKGKEHKDSKKDSGISSSSSPPLRFWGSTAGRSRKKSVSGIKSRARTKVQGQLLSQGQERQLKRSSSLPADVTHHAASHLKMHYEELSDGQTSSMENVDPDTDTSPSQSQSESQQMNDQHSEVSEHGDDPLQAVEDAKISQDMLQVLDGIGKLSVNLGAAEKPCTDGDSLRSETDSSQSEVTDRTSPDPSSGESSEQKDYSSDDLSPDVASHQPSAVNHLHLSDVKKQLSSEFSADPQREADKHLPAELVIVCTHEDTASGDSQKSSDSSSSSWAFDDTPGDSSQGPDSSDQNGNSTGEDSDKLTSSLSSLNTDSPSASAHQSPETDRGQAQDSAIGSDPSTTSLDPCTTSADPCTTRSDPCTTRSDPCTTNADPCTTKSDPCTTSSDPCTTNADPCTTRSDPCTTSSDPCTTNADPCTTKSDPCTTNADPCTTNADPCTAKSNHCTAKSDPCTTKSDPCTTSSYTCTTNADPCTSSSDPCTTSSDPCTTDPDPSTTNSDPSATNSEGSHPDTSVEQRPYQGDLSSSSSEGGKRATEIIRESNCMSFFVQSPYLNNQYPMFQFPPPPLFVNNRGRGHFIPAPLKETYGNVPDFFVPQTNGTFLGYKLNRKLESQQGNFVYRHSSNDNGQTYLSDMTGAQYDKTWTNRSSRGRPVMISRGCLRRGRGGLFVRERGGYSAGRGGSSGSRTRMSEGRYPSFFHPFKKRGRSKADHFSRRRMQEQNCRERQEQLEGGGVYGTARDGEMSPWNSPNNGFSRGRTPFRTTVNQSAHRHRSAPPAQNLRVAEGGMHYRVRRPRSLSRSVRHSYGPRNSPLPQNGQFWCQYSPRMARHQRHDQESYTPRWNYGSNRYRWSRSTHSVWHPRQNAGRDGQSRLDSSSGSAGQQEFYPNQQNGGHPSSQTDGELSSLQLGTSVDHVEGQNREEQDIHQKTIIVTPQEMCQQNGSQMPEHVEQEVVSAQNERSTDSTEGDNVALQHGSHPPHLNEHSSMPHVREGQYNANHGQWQMNHRQQYRRRQRDGSNGTHWRAMNRSDSPKYPCRLKTSQWWHEPHSPKYFQQRGCRQQIGATGMHCPERYVEYEQGMNTAMHSNGADAARWNQNNAGEFPLWNNEGHVRMTGSPPFLAGDSLQTNFLRKMVQVLQEQNIDHTEAEHALQTLMRMHLPSETGENLKNILMHHLNGNLAYSSSKQGRMVRPCTVQGNKNNYPPNARQQGNYHHFDDGGNSNQNFNVSFKVGPQTSDVNHPGNYMNYMVSPPHGQPMSQPNIHGQHVSHASYPIHRYHQQGGFPGNRRQFQREKQQWRKSVKEGHAHYVYYLDNRDKKTGAQLPARGQPDQNQKPTWNHQNINQLPRFSDVNTNQQNCVSVADRYDQIQQAHTFIQHKGQQSGHIGQDNPRPSYVDQAGRPALQSARQARHGGMNSGCPVSETQPNLNIKPAMQANEVETSGAPAHSVSPGFDTAGHQNTVDKVNGNAAPEENVSAARPQMPHVSNTNQPVPMGVGNFLQPGAPIPTPLIPVQFPPVNNPLLPPVNTPMFHPLQTPFIQTMNVPYPQQNVFQFPSPIPLIPVANPGQVCTAPNIFQYPDPSAGQQPLPVDLSQAQQQACLDKPYGFAGNQPLVQFLPNQTNPLPANQVHPPPLVDNALRAGDVNGNDC